MARWMVVGRFYGKADDCLVPVMHNVGDVIDYSTGTASTALAPLDAAARAQRDAHRSLLQNQGLTAQWDLAYLRNLSNLNARQRQTVDAAAA